MFLKAILLFLLAFTAQPLLFYDSYVTNKCNVNFDIVSLYTIIKQNYLKYPIYFANNYTDIAEEVIKLIENTFQTILTHNSDT